MRRIVCAMVAVALGLLAVTAGWALGPPPITMWDEVAGMPRFELICPDASAPGLAILQDRFNVFRLGDRMVIVSMPASETTGVWYGRVGSDGRLVIDHALTLAEGRARWPRPCAYLTGKEE